MEIYPLTKVFGRMLKNYSRKYVFYVKGNTIISNKTEGKYNYIKHIINMNSPFSSISKLNPFALNILMLSISMDSFTAVNSSC